MVDASRSLDENDQKILNLVLDKKAIILLNKTDLETVVSKEMLAEQLPGREIPMIEISAKEELGIQELEKTLEKMFLKGSLSFPSRYWFTIGHRGVFSLTRWSWWIPTGFLVSRRTQVLSRASSLFRLRGCHPVSPDFPFRSPIMISCSLPTVLQPRS